MSQDPSFSRYSLALLGLLFCFACSLQVSPHGTAEVHRQARRDRSLPLAKLHAATDSTKPGCDADAPGCGTAPDDPDEEEEAEQAADVPQTEPTGSTVTAAGAGVEQTSPGSRAPMKMIASFDGLGFGFSGPQGTATLRNPSDNSLAVGPNHIVQIVNSRIAVFSKKGEVLYGPVVTNTIFAGFGGQCEKQVSGDAVVRYDQLANRWLYVLPIFRRPPGEPKGDYSMCYAISEGADPLGPYYRYEFKRPLFPDYPRPAIWPDGYYIPTSTGDTVIQKHACVADRTKMLQGLPATEQCIIIDGPNFLNNADIDGTALPPTGAPNLMIAAGASQLRKQFSDDGLYIYKFHVDWESPEKTAVSEPVKIAVAPYNYLCNGQLTSCVPQPGTDRRLDAQGDKIMQRLVYRNIDGRESIIGLHSVNTRASGGGVRWYELRLDAHREPVLYQQGTYAPDQFYRWMGSMGMDHQGNIGVGYSFGGTPHFAGQRFAGRLAQDPPGALTFHETVLAEGAAPQTNTLRWEDYATTTMDPSDDCTFWYVGDYLKAGAPSYTSKIGGFRMPGCLRGTVSGSVYFDRNHDGKRSADEPGVAAKAIAYTGSEAGKLTTDAAGNFTASLPADPAYFDPAYTFSSPVAGNSIRVQLKGQDSLTGIDFGATCVVRNRGGEKTRFWTKYGGKLLLQQHDAAWRKLVDTKLHLINPKPGADGLEQLRKLLGKQSGSTELLTIALNAAFGKQDANVTVHDPIAGDWPSVKTLMDRASQNASAADRYRGLFASLNNNSAFVTPSSPSGCPSL